MAGAHRYLAWLAQQRFVPAYCKERDYPPFSPVEVFDITVADDRSKFRWVYDLPGITGNETLGAIGFTGIAETKQERGGVITFDLPTISRVPEYTDLEFPTLLYVKEAMDVDDAVLTPDREDALAGAPSFKSSGWWKEELGLLFVEQMSPGAGDGTWIVDVLSLRTECDCLVAECEVFRTPCNDTRWRVGDTIDVWDDMGCVLRVTQEDLDELAGAGTPWKAAAIRTAGDCASSEPSPFPEDCLPYEDPCECHFTFLPACCINLD